MPAAAAEGIPEGEEEEDDIHLQLTGSSSPDEGASTQTTEIELGSGQRSTPGASEAGTSQGLMREMMQVLHHYTETTHADLAGICQELQGLRQDMAHDREQNRTRALGMESLAEAVRAMVAAINCQTDVMAAMSAEWQHQKEDSNCHVDEHSNQNKNVSSI